MITEITIAVRYSALPCPNGCSLSGSLLANFVPTIVIIEDAASDILLTASKMIAIDPAIAPTVALKADKNILFKLNCR